MKINTDKPYFGLFNDSYPPIMDGVSLTVKNYAYWLQQMGLNPCIVTPWMHNLNNINPDYDLYSYMSVPIVHRKPYRYGVPEFDPFIWKKLEQQHFSIVHAHCPFSSGRLAQHIANKQNIPLIATFHSKYRADLERSLKLKALVDYQIRKIVRFYESAAEVWIPQAQVEETLREYGYKGAVTVVDNGNDLLVGDISLQCAKNDARKRLGFNDDELVLLFVGQHIYEKGVDIILKSLELLKGVKFKMFFIGTGYAVEAMKRMVKDLGLTERVELLGIINDREQLRDYYLAAHIFLFPSFYDNAPLVIREAAMLGTPSILLKDSTAAEIITPDINGFLCSNTPDAYASLVSRLNNERDNIAQVGEMASKTIARTWQDIVEEVSDRYSSIIKRHERR